MAGRHWLVAIGWLALCAGHAAGAEAVNEFCPIVPANPATVDHAVIHMGKTVRFCCDDCLNKFLDDPDAYLKQLPQFPREEATPTPAAPEPARDWLAWHTYYLAAEWAATVAEKHRALALYVLSVSLVFMAGKRWRARRGQRGTDTSELAEAKAATGLFTASNLFILLLCGALVDALWGDVWRTPTAAVASMPRQPTSRVEDFMTLLLQLNELSDQELLEARSGVPHRLQAVYYRGNDERNPRLFNNGLYCTCTFHVGLRDADGLEVEHGAPVEGRQLFVEVEIVRAPGASASFYTDAAMAPVCLGHLHLPRFGDNELSLPDEEQVRFEIVESGERWRARYPLGEVKAARRGVVYLSAQPRMGEYLAAARPHYGIGYHLIVKDGQLAARSHLWMAPLYYSVRDLEGWFSHERLPFIPDGFPTRPAESEEN